MNSTLGSDPTMDVCLGCHQIDKANPWLALPILVIGILSIFGNACVIAVLLLHLNPMKHSSNHLIFMLSLGLSDFGSGLCFCAFSARYALVGHGPYSQTEMEIGAGLKYFFLTNSLISVIGISIDKLMFIQNPYAYQRCWNRKRCLGLVISYWILIAFLSLLPTQLFPISQYYYRFNLDTYEFNTEHKSEISALLIVRCLLLVTMLLTLLIGYGRLICIANSKLCALHSAQMQSPQQKQEMDKRHLFSSLGVKMIVLIMITFFLLNGPYFIVLIIFAKESQSDVSHKAMATTIRFFFVWFAQLQTCTNVVVYSGAYKPFREGIQQLFRCRNSGLLLSMRRSTNTMVETNENLLKVNNNSNHQPGQGVVPMTANGN